MRAGASSVAVSSNPLRLISCCVGASTRTMSCGFLPTRVCPSTTIWPNAISACPNSSKRPPGVSVPSMVPSPSAPSAPTLLRRANRAATSSMSSLSHFTATLPIRDHPGRLNSYEKRNKETKQIKKRTEVRFFYLALRVRFECASSARRVARQCGNCRYGLLNSFHGSLTFGIVSISTFMLRPPTLRVSRM